MLALEIIANRRIDEAVADGSLDVPHLHGVPIDLSDYFNLPAELRMAWSILRNANCVPREVALSREIESLRERIGSSAEDDVRRSLERVLREKEMTLRMMFERSSRARRG